MPSKTITLAQLRTYAVARSLFGPMGLSAALKKLGFVQADPLRNPARAQDLTLRHRVAGYRAGDLERQYPRLAVEEDFFVNYGFVPRNVYALMHPRSGASPWTAARQRQAAQVAAFVREQGVAHPQVVDEHFAHGKVRNWFGGNSRASTQLLDGMHYRSLLRVAKRESGTRTYAVAPHPARPFEPPADEAGIEAALDALVDVVVNKYAPFPETTLSQLISRLRYAVPQWQHLRRAAVARAKERLPCATVDGKRWYWPAGENPASAKHAKHLSESPPVRLLAPFDPVVWDRLRFELFWGWAYRFEAYTPAAKRVRGHYALPLLSGEQVIGWGNLAWRGGELQAQLGYVNGQAPTGKAFKRALEEELERVKLFLAGYGD